MNDRERVFKLVVDQITLFASLYPRSRDIEAVRHELERADAFGPIIDPTSWIKSQMDREALTELVQAALSFAFAAEKFTEERDAIIEQRTKGAAT